MPDSYSRAQTRESGESAKNGLEYESFEYESRLDTPLVERRHRPVRPKTGIRRPTAVRKSRRGRKRNGGEKPLGRSRLQAEERKDVSVREGGGKCRGAREFPSYVYSSRTPSLSLPLLLVRTQEKRALKRGRGRFHERALVQGTPHSHLPRLPSSSTWYAREG